MANQYTSKILEVENLGVIDYLTAWGLQKDYFKGLYNGESREKLLLLEHPHTYTFGKSGDKNNLLLSEKELNEKGIKVYDVDRGGDVTYHGPGQLVAYSIINLRKWKTDVNEYLRALEEVVIGTCSEFGLNAERLRGYTGVWIENRKICAIGAKVTNWITMHGFALNVNTDLSFFKGIIPCGIKSKEVTSMKKELGFALDMEQVKKKVAKNFASIFEFKETVINEELKIKNEELSV